MTLLISVHHMSGNSLDVAYGAVFASDKIAVAHQRHTLALNPLYAVEHISPVLHPCQCHDAALEPCRRSEYDTLLAADDKRQHAAPRNRQSHTISFVHQRHSLVNYLVVVHIVELVIFAAASSGRQSMCHILAVAVSELSARCSPSAMFFSHLFPDTLDAMVAYASMGDIRRMAL